jgi:hypothetical protein
MFGNSWMLYGKNNWITLKWIFKNYIINLKVQNELDKNWCFWWEYWFDPNWDHDWKQGGPDECHAHETNYQSNISYIQFGRESKMKFVIILVLFFSISCILEQQPHNPHCLHLTHQTGQCSTLHGVYLGTKKMGNYILIFVNFPISELKYYATIIK